LRFYRRTAVLPDGRCLPARRLCLAYSRMAGPLQTPHCCHTLSSSRFSWDGSPEHGQAGRVYLPLPACLPRFTTPPWQDLQVSAWFCRCCCILLPACCHLLPPPACLCLQGLADMPPHTTCCYTCGSLCTYLMDCVAVHHQERGGPHLRAAGLAADTATFAVGAGLHFPFSWTFLLNTWILST